MSTEIPAMKEHLQSLLVGRLDLDEAQAQLALRALEESPELRQWLRTQYHMDTVLSIALDPARADFPNRLRVATANPATEQFLQRVHTARGRSRRPRRASHPWGQGIFVAAAALLVAGFCALMSWHAAIEPPRLEAQSGNSAVLSGQVQVDSHRVESIPADADFTVTGTRSAVITLGQDSRAELTPASQASLHASRDGSRDCELVTGSGSFSLNGSASITTGVASVSGQHAQVAAEWSSRPASAPQQALDERSTRSLKISVSSGSARILTAQLSQLLCPHETLVLEVSTRHAVTASHRGFQGQVWGIAHQAHDWALAVGDARTQRTCLLPNDLVVTIDHLSGDPSEIRKGDSIEVQFAPGRNDLVVSAVVTSAADSPPAR